MGFSLFPGLGVPTETATAARKIYNIQHIYLRIGDQLDTIQEGVDLTLLDPSASLNADTVFRLALVTAFQYSELLPDPLAEQATHQRMDWKYALRLPIQHPGVLATSLCNFRQNLWSFPSSAREFSRILVALGQTGLFPKSSNLTLTYTEVLDTVCKITRLYWLNQGMRAALSELATVAPHWLGEVAMPHWYENYKETGTDLDYSQIIPENTLQVANLLGSDFFHLLNALGQQKTFEYTHLVEINRLSQLFAEQYFQNNRSTHWRIPGCQGCGRIG